MDYIYAKLNKEVIERFLTYRGVTTDTAEVIINNTSYTIKANVFVDDVINETSRHAVSGLAVKNYVDSTKVTNYNFLSNKPSIEGVTLQNNKTLSDLNLNSLTNREIDDILS